MLLLQRTRRERSGGQHPIKTRFIREGSCLTGVGEDWFIHLVVNGAVADARCTTWAGHLVQLACARLLTPRRCSGFRQMLPRCTEFLLGFPAWFISREKFQLRSSNSG